MLVNHPLNYAPPSKKVLLETKELTVEFSSTDGKVRAVNDVSLAIREGTTHGLVGESGSEKLLLDARFSSF